MTSEVEYFPNSYTESNGDIFISRGRTTECKIKIFRGGKGWWMGRGVAVKDA